MNRRNLSLFLVGLVLIPSSLISAAVQKKPMDPKCSCEDCKKCGPKCDCKKKCKCKLKCKCKSKCCKKEQSPERSPQGSVPHSRPPHGRPSPSRHGRPTVGGPYHHRPRQKPSDMEYEVIMRKFDDNKDGKMQKEEKRAAYSWLNKISQAFK